MAEFDYSKPFTIPGQELNLVPNLLPPASYKPDLTDRIADSAERGYKFYRQSELINKPLTRDSAEEVARLQKEIEEIPENPALKRFQEAQGWKESFKVLAEEPVETISGLLAESLGSLIPKALKTVPAHMLVGAGAGFAIGGPPGAAVGARAGMITGTGVTSYSLEYAGKILESLREEGVDIKDPEQLVLAFNTPELIDGIKDKAVRKGVPIAAFDALSAGVAGKFLARPAAGLLGRIGQTAAEVGQQVAYAGGGELTGELASGEKISPPSILAEMLLEPIAGGPEIVSGVLTRKTRPLGTERTRRDTQREERIPPPQQERQEPGRAIPVAQTGSEAAPASGVLQTPTAQVDIPQAITQQTGWTFNPVSSANALTSESVAQLTPEQRAELPPPSWSFTDPTTGTTIYVPQTASVEQGVEQIRKKPLAGTTLQGERRSPSQGQAEGQVQIPAAPPAIEVIGQGTPEQQPLLDKLLQKVNEENKATPGLPIRRIEIVTDTERGIYTVPGAGGFDTMRVNLDRLHRQTNMTNVERYLSLATNEEIIHNASGYTVYDEWQHLVPEQKSKIPFPEFYDQRMRTIHSEMTPAQLTRTQEAYGKPLTPEGIADEFVRMLVQQKMRGEITEQEILGPTTIQHLKNILRKMIQVLANAVGVKRQNLQAHVNAIESILKEQTARQPAERFETAEQPVGATEPTPEGGPYTRFLTKPESTRKREKDLEARLSAEAFDKMRREAGLGEKPPPPTEKEVKEQERRERFRGMRRDPRIAGAADPASKLADEQGDKVWNEDEVETVMMGVTDTVNGRPMNTQASTNASKEWAGERIKESGLEAQQDEGTGGWRFTGGENHEGGRRLVEIIEREFAIPDGPDRDNATLLASLINSVRINFDAGFLDNIVDATTGRRLYVLTQGEASHRGRALQALAMHPRLIEVVGRHIEAHLEKTWYNQYGGEVIEGVMAEIRKGVQAFMTKPLINQILANNPSLQGALDMVTTLSEDEKALPDAGTLIEQIFKKPFYKLSDFGKALEKELVKNYGVEPKEAAKVAKEFQNAFDPSLKQGAHEALKTAVANLTYLKKAKVKSRKTIEQLVMKLIESGDLDSGKILRDIAIENHWKPPTDDQIAYMKKLSDRLTELKNLSPEDLAELKKTEATEEDIEKARAIKEAGLDAEIKAVRKKMEIEWARMTKPIHWTSIIPFVGTPELKANTARAINEFIAANLLFKLGFGPRQAVAIVSQWLSFVPTRAIAGAIVNHQHASTWAEKQPFLKEVATQLRQGYQQQFASWRSALTAMQSALLGRGEAQNVMQLMGAASALDRLTKQAEEKWTQGNYAYASLLYFISSVKMGYRIAQGLDQLQGVPAEYQSRRQQVVRGLMDQGKTRVEAEHSADLVLGNIKHDWMLASARAKDLLEEAGAEVTPQKIRQGAMNVVRRWQYQRIAELDLPADEYEAVNDLMRNTYGWNRKEVKGIGGGFARLLRQVEQVSERHGFPLVFTRFANAIGIGINRVLAYTPLWKQANVGGGKGDSPWFSDETERAQRRVEAYVGTSLGAIAFLMAITGTWIVRLKWPKDKEERDLFEREGHRPNTVEIPIGETEFIPISLNNSPMMFVSPFLAAGAALREKLDETAKKQAALDAQAAELGVTAEKLPGLSPADMGLVAWEAFKQAVLGGRTAAGLIGSVSTYGTPNAKKSVASYASALIPWLPGAQEVSRMAGVTLDEKMASIGDLLLPLPTSQARKVNLLGDPVRTPNDIQRITQIMTGGTYLGIVDTQRARDEAAYNALFVSGFRPPAIQPTKGYLINNEIRPLTQSELSRFTQSRGRYMKDALATFVPTGDEKQDKAEARRLYQQANEQALSEFGASNVPRSYGGTTRVSSGRARRPSAGVRRGIRRIRSPRLGRLRTRRIRQVRPRRSRRITRLAA